MTTRLDALSAMPQPAHVGPLALKQRLDRLHANVRREDEELHRDELLRAVLRGLREHPRAGEAPAS
jgi:hypothetical protein